MSGFSHHCDNICDKDNLGDLLGSQFQGTQSHEESMVSTGSMILGVWGWGSWQSQHWRKKEEGRL